MTAYRRGDVVLVPFDFTDRSGTKWRPAVVVSSDSYNAGTPDVLIASITSNLGAISHPGDRRLTDWQAAGLLKPSLAQTKLATIASSLVGRRLGALSPADLAAFDQGLSSALDLP
jgi:mRNA interferase MazF